MRKANRVRVRVEFFKIWAIFLRTVAAHARTRRCVRIAWASIRVLRIYYKIVRWCFQFYLWVVMQRQNTKLINWLCLKHDTKKSRQKYASVIFQLIQLSPKNSTFCLRRYFVALTFFRQIFGFKFLTNYNSLRLNNNRFKHLNNC